jgi:hypothetical protein
MLRLSKGLVMFFKFPFCRVDSGRGATLSSEELWLMDAKLLMNFLSAQNLFEIKLTQDYLNGRNMFNDLAQI